MLMHARSRSPLYYMWSKCTVCDTELKNPMAMRAHLKSSCHERGVRLAHAARSTRRFIASAGAAALRQRCVDPRPRALSRLYSYIAREGDSEWPIRETVNRVWGRMLQVHTKSMRTWWANVLASTQLPPELQREVASWLHVDASPLQRAPSGFSKSGNLTILDWRWEADSQRRRRCTLFHAKDSITTQAKRRRLSVSSAQSMDLRSRELTCVMLRYFSTYGVNHPLLCTR